MPADQVPPARGIPAPTGATYHLGRRGAANRHLRIYHKGDEAAANDKLPWMEPIWQGAGWNEKTKACRVEIEHGSAWLIQREFDSLTKLIACERG